MKGIILSGINNIYTVSVKGKEIECRIKGKILKQKEKYYNPIAVGDLVIIEQDPYSQTTGWITGREKRSSYLLRWNRKKQAPQVMAANTNILICVTSVQSPPFRPRFIDRMLIAAESGGIKPVILVNKIDLGMDTQIKKRTKNYQDIGYDVIFSSANTGKGIKQLKKKLKNKTSVFVGQSGVGKTSILNALEPSLALKIGQVSSKYDRGSHTTSNALMVHLDNGYRIIDTPGIRMLHLADIEVEELRFYFPEFKIYQPACAYPSCLHIDEPDCAVKKALMENKIHNDRYQSYLNIYKDLNNHKIK